MGFLQFSSLIYGLVCNSAFGRERVRHGMAEAFGGGSDSQL